MVNYREFKIGELFDIHPTKSYGLTNSKLFKNKGSTPVVVNSSLNNGIGGYVDLPATEKGNMITYSDTTTSEGIFYQPNDFIGYSHVQGLYAREKYKWTEKSLLYFLAVFKKQAKGRFDYATKFNRKIASEMIIKLPVDEKEEIDFKYMENYISELEEERVSELEEERVSELCTYLKISGLEDYRLTKQDIYLLKESQLKSTRSYRIGDIFEIRSSKKKFNANTVKFDGKHPYVARSSANNGIRGFINQEEKYLNEANTISFGQDTATMFYQDKPYFTGDKIKIMKLKNKDLNDKIACYLITVMKKSFQNFAWGQTSFNENVLKNVKIELPIQNDEIDYEYIEKYMKVIQKIAIKDVIILKDSIINSTKMCIS